jgi:hypothetical protein
VIEQDVIKSCRHHRNIIGFTDAFEQALKKKSPLCPYVLSQARPPDISWHFARLHTYFKAVQTGCPDPFLFLINHGPQETDSSLVQQVRDDLSDLQKSRNDARTIQLIAKVLVNKGWLVPLQIEKASLDPLHN